jgi:hypothetical protein
MTQVVTGVPKELHDKAPSGMVVAETAEEAAEKVEALKAQQSALPKFPPGGMPPGMGGPGMGGPAMRPPAEPLPDVEVVLPEAASRDELLAYAQGLVTSLVGAEGNPSFQHRAMLIQHVVALANMKE